MLTDYAPTPKPATQPYPIHQTPNTSQQPPTNPLIVKPNPPLIKKALKLPPPTKGQFNKVISIETRNNTEINVGGKQEKLQLTLC
jgi:hypothetical protein